jgi:hypothetical protein
MSGSASARESRVESSFFCGRRRFVVVALEFAAFFSIRETNLAWRARRAVFFELRSVVVATAGVVVFERVALVRIEARP